jgi:ketosteroid isomerase-like protein
LLTRWFAILDGGSPSDVLDLISDDFRISIVFSTGPDAAQDFSGDRDALIGYLEQRERGTRTHHMLSAAVRGSDEIYLGEVRRGGVYEASFVAAGRIGATGRLERLLIGRSPGVRFTA